jgi:pyrroline-5-carboxylate reductase
MKVGVIGAGNLGMAIAKNASKNAEVIALKRKKVDTEGIRVVDRIDEIKDCEIFFVTLKPNVFRKNFEKIGAIAKDKPVISFAAGVGLDEMRKYIKNPYRAMTNLAIEKHSLVAYYPPETIEYISFLDADFMECESESELENTTSYLGSSPAIVAYLIHAFVLAALKDGISYEKALKLALASFRSSTNLYEQLGLEEVVRRVATPGGTTIEGIIRILNAKNWLIEALNEASMKARKI